MITQTDLGASFRYDFDTVGEGFPLHTHDEHLKHTIEVLEGSVLVQGETWQTRLTPSDGVFVFDGVQPHSVRAEVAPTVTVHAFVNGRPPEYADLAFEDLNYTLTGPRWQF